MFVEYHVLVSFRIREPWSTLRCLSGQVEFFNLLLTWVMGILLNYAGLK
jgi:hypothetical protein